MGVRSAISVRFVISCPIAGFGSETSGHVSFQLSPVHGRHLGLIDRPLGSTVDYAVIAQAGSNGTSGRGAAW